MSRRKLIIVTAGATTLFWAIVLSVLLWAISTPFPDEALAFTSAEGYQHVLWMSNTNTNPVVVTFDYMGTNMSDPRSASVMFESEIAPTNRIGIGVRRAVK